jgi:hypothetical protein
MKLFVVASLSLRRLSSLSEMAYIFFLDHELLKGFLEFQGTDRDVGLGNLVA